jgi:hypothetical protein
MDDTEKLASARTEEFCLPDRLHRPRLRRKDAAEYLELRWGIKIAPSTLAKWACVGGGPTFQRMNRMPLYSRIELDAWVQKKLGPAISNTSSLGRGDEHL